MRAPTAMSGPTHALPAMPQTSYGQHPGSTRTGPPGLRKEKVPPQQEAPGGRANHIHQRRSGHATDEGSTDKPRGYTSRGSGFGSFGSGRRG